MVQKELATSKNAPKYTGTQKVLHWSTALIVLILVTSGMMYFFEISPKTAIRTHQIFGQVLIFLLIWRIALKVLRRSVSAHSQHNAAERLLAGIVHLALYGALITFVITGYVSASSLRDTMLLLPLDIGFARSNTGEQFIETHYLMKWVLLALITLHLAGAAKHLIWDKDNTFSAMWFSKRKQTDEEGNKT